MRFERAPACEKLSFKIFEIAKITDQSTLVQIRNSAGHLTQGIRVSFP
jgi:hypothetical protein